MASRKSVRVTCALIFDRGAWLVAQRNRNQKMAYKWEFAGGKIQPGESAEDCIVRELQEELGITVAPIRVLEAFHHHYPEFSIELIPVQCRLVSGVPSPREHLQILWTPARFLRLLDFAAADIPIIDFIPRA